MVASVSFRHWTPFVRSGSKRRASFALPTASAKAVAGRNAILTSRQRFDERRGKDKFPAAAQRDADELSTNFPLTDDECDAGGLKY